MKLIIPIWLKRYMICIQFQLCLPNANVCLVVWWRTGKSTVGIILFGLVTSAKLTKYGKGWLEKVKFILGGLRACSVGGMVPAAWASSCY